MINHIPAQIYASWNQEVEIDPIAYILIKALHNDNVLFDNIGGHCTYGFMIEYGGGGGRG